ncbi:MAG: molybdopterin-binding protein [Lachnospiraceae bacterium]|nr:molybdopterin-binding protein [Lachnospiraceae bacterium]
MKLMKTEDAVGQILCQDITQIIKDGYKGPVFRKGHVITEKDIPVLLSVGKDNIYIWENDGSLVHENDGAKILYDISAGKNIRPGDDIKEGKIELFSEIDGLFKIDREKLLAVNSLGEMMIASRHGDFPVKAGDKLAGERIIPLAIAKEKMETARETVFGRTDRSETRAGTGDGAGKIFDVLPFHHKKVGIVTTGNEVYYGRIQDTFTDVVMEKLAEYDTEVIGHEISSDDAEMEISCIKKLLAAGADMILCTGGMSVDPDDRTPLAIRTVAGGQVTYGAPVLPGAMFMLAYYNNVIPLVGLPGCVMHAKRTVFDLILPRLMADDPVSREGISALGEGGMCLNCSVCTFPNCGFGK